jgi:mannose-1-phosphate guanylyltransferase/mannose-1-phosphate guanylyltransferase/phosphomannomutase
MRVMIMAAGLGTRLRPLTEHLPKPVAPVGNRPCVDYLLRRIADAGCTGAIMNLHYHPQTIIDTIGDGADYGISVEYSIEEELLGTAGGTRKCQAFLTAEDDVFLVTSGDGLHTIDLATLAAAHRASGALATITVKRVEDITGFGVVVTDADGRVTSFQEKPAPEDALSDLVNVGVYCFNAAIFDEIPAEGQSDFGSEILPRLVAAGADVRAWVTDAFWSDIGSLEELLATNLAIAAGAVDVDPDGDLIMDSDCGLPNVSPDSVITGPVLIGEGAEVHSGATIIGPAVIGQRAVIEQGAVVEQALVLPEAEIHADSPASGILGDVENLDAVWQR